MLNKFHDFMSAQEHLKVQQSADLLDSVAVSTPLILCFIFILVTILIFFFFNIY